MKLRPSTPAITSPAPLSRFSDLSDLRKLLASVPPVRVSNFCILHFFEFSDLKFLVIVFIFLNDSICFRRLCSHQSLLSGFVFFHLNDAISFVFFNFFLNLLYILIDFVF